MGFAVTRPAAGAENCIYQLLQPEPYFVLGSRVTPQSSFLVVDVCGKSADQVRADLKRVAQERAQTEARAIVPAAEVVRVQRETRVVGDRLKKERDKALKAAAEKERRWWSWLWD